MKDNVSKNVSDSELRDRIEYHMTCRNLSQNALSRASDVPQSTISTFLSKGYLPSVSTLLRICNGMNISLATLLATDDEAPASLSPDERRLISYYEHLTDAHRKFLVETAQNLVKAQKNEITKSRS